MVVPRTRNVALGFVTQPLGTKLVVVLHRLGVREEV
jgi:hypothetical protein